MVPTEYIKVGNYVLFKHGTDTAVDLITKIEDGTVYCDIVERNESYTSNVGNGIAAQFGINHLSNSSMHTPYPEYKIKKEIKEWLDSI